MCIITIMKIICMYKWHYKRRRQQACKIVLCKNLSSKLLDCCFSYVVVCQSAVQSTEIIFFIKYEKIYIALKKYKEGFVPSLLVLILIDDVLWWWRWCASTTNKNSGGYIIILRRTVMLLFSYNSSFFKHILW